MVDPTASLESVDIGVIWPGDNQSTPMLTSNSSPFLYLEDIYDQQRPVISLVNKYVTPIWYVVGFPGNILAFVVWIRPRMRPSSGCYLAALAMADFVFLILQLLFELQSTWNIKVLELPFVCEVFPIFFYAFQYLSPLLVLGFTIERYISICHPFQREKFCSTSRAMKTIVFLLLLSLIINAVQGYFWTYKQDCSPRTEVTKGGTKSVWSVWSWTTELLVFAVVPLTILALNILVILEMKKVSRNEEKQLCLKKGHKGSATTYMLLAVSFYLIFTTLPVTICYAMYFNFPEGDFTMPMEEISNDPTWQSHLTYFTVRTIVQELGMSHYAGNFYIYILTGKLFRKELRIVFYGLFCKSKAALLMRPRYEDVRMIRDPHGSGSNGAASQL